MVSMMPLARSSSLGEGNLATTSLQLEPKAKRYRAPVTLELSQLGTNRVLLVSRGKSCATAARKLGAQAFAADISPYARILCHAKLSPPPSLDAALEATKPLVDATSSDDDGTRPHPPMLPSDIRQTRLLPSASQ